MMKTTSSASLSDRLPLPPTPHHHLHDLHLRIKFFKFFKFFGSSPSFVVVDDDDDDFFVFFFFLAVLVASRAAPNPKFILESAQNPGVFSPLPRTLNRFLINTETPPAAIFQRNNYSHNFPICLSKKKEKQIV
jgi:hypothetical protein